MPSVEVNAKVKDRLERYKTEKGCKTFSDAINLLLFEHKLLKDRELNNF